MVKLKEWYHKYKDYIIVILLILLSFKGCQSCTKTRQLEYMEIEKCFIIDSLEKINNNLNDNIDSLNNVITLYKYKSETLQDFNENLKRTNNNLSKSNRNLSETNKNLINKE